MGASHHDPAGMCWSCHHLGAGQQRFTADIAEGLHESGSRSEDEMFSLFHGPVEGDTEYFYIVFIHGVNDDFSEIFNGHQLAGDLIQFHGPQII